ncbi:PAS domain-containing protein, partial [Klebsiella pneumoniae]|uniref:PAS domain-containing protein n=1 Tax=Klebsiella pneumoniae TaxID=573 RepID=UPI003852A094
QDGQKLLQLADMVCDRLELRRLDIARSRGPGRFAAGLATSNAAVITCDAQRVVDHCNVAAAALFGRSPETMAGLPLETLIAPSDRAIVRAALARD